MGTRRNKKVDTYSNNKTLTWNQFRCPTSPRATDAERAIMKKLLFGRTGEILAGKKGKRRVTNKFSKSGCWRLKPQQTFEVSFTELCWTGQGVGKNQASLTKGLNAIMPLARRPNTTEFPASRAKYAVRILIWWKWVSLKFSCNSFKFILPTIYIAGENIRFSSLFVETSPRRRRAGRNGCFRRLLFIGWEMHNH